MMEYEVGYTKWTIEPHFKDFTPKLSVTDL